MLEKKKRKNDDVTKTTGFFSRTYKREKNYEIVLNCDLMLTFRNLNNKKENPFEKHVNK